MTVTMTIEEFDELREAKQKLAAVYEYLYQKVRYAVEADSVWGDKAFRFAKEMPCQDVAGLVHLVGVWPKYENIDQFEETEA